VRTGIAAVAASLALLWVAVAPAGDAEVPERYMKVDQVKAFLDQGRTMRFVDVRPRDQYERLHIVGAASVPLAELPGRLDEIPREDLVVVY
jgi:rhodanese-related sulfurtransferase